MIFSWLILRNIFHVCYCATFTVIFLFQQNRRCVATQLGGPWSYIFCFAVWPRSSSWVALR